MSAPGPNPYTPPSGGAEQPGPTRASGEPRHLNTAIIILIVLAALGIAAALMGLVSTALGFGSTPPPAQPGMPPGFAEAQQKMYEEMREASFPTLGMLITLAGGCIDGAVLYGAILAKQVKERGRQLLVSPALPLVVGYTLVKLVWTLFVTVRTFEVVQRFMDRLQASMGSSGDASTIMNTAVVAGVVGGAVVSVVWSCLLVAVYLWARSVLSRDDVVEHFAAAG